MFRQKKKHKKSDNTEQHINDIEKSVPPDTDFAKTDEDDIEARSELESNTPASNLDDVVVEIKSSLEELKSDYQEQLKALQETVLLLTENHDQTEPDNDLKHLETISADSEEACHSAISEDIAVSESNAFIANVAKTLKLPPAELEAICDSDTFCSWLEKADGFSGQSRKESFSSALEQAEQERTAKICQAFLTEAYGFESMPQKSAKDLYAPNVRNVPVVAKKSFSVNDFQKKSLAFVKGLISDSEYQQFKQQFDQACNEGRVINS